MVDKKDIPVLDVDYHLREYDEQDVLEYLEQCYSFNRDPAIEKAINEIKRLRAALGNENEAVKAIRETKERVTAKWFDDMIKEMK